jgi:hypothetical protein
MPTYLDLLPDELYLKIITPLFTQCVKEVAHKCSLAYKHRTLQGYHTYDAYEELFSKSRSNLAVVYAWLVGKRKSGCHMWTDGRILYSYQLVIGITQPDGYKVMRQLTARTGSFVSVTTSSHCNLAASYADRVFDTPMEIAMNTHLFSVIDQ